MKWCVGQATLPSWYHKTQNCWHAAPHNVMSYSQFIPLLNTRESKGLKIAKFTKHTHIRKKSAIYSFAEHINKDIMTEYSRTDWNVSSQRSPFPEVGKWHHCLFGGSLTFSHLTTYIYIYIYIYMSYRTANLQMLHFIYLFNKYTYWIF